MAIREVFVNCQTDYVCDRNKIVSNPFKAIQYTESDIRSMGTSLVNVGYSFPIVVFEDKGVIYCLDGHLRLEALKYLETSHKRLDGRYVVPAQIPVVFKDCSLKESLKLILQLSHKSTDEEVYFSRYFDGRW